jgi:hypothetical protein
MRGWIAIGVMSAVMLAGCAKRVPEGRGAAPRAADLLPLAVGNRWTYDAQFLGEQREQTVEIVGKEGPFFRDSEGAELTVDRYGLRDRKRYLLQEPIEVGRTWSNVVALSSTERYEVIEVGADCQVKAGRFKGCVKVEGRNPINENTTLVNVMTFAPEVGIVSIETLTESQGRRVPQTQLALKSYKLNPAEARAQP